MTDIALAELLATVPPGHRPLPWSWEDEERDIRSRLCLCCGEPGHHQETVEAHVADHGLTEGVCIGDDGRLHDGHHRVIAASALGIELVPLETRAESDARWLRDHGTFVWELRRFGDVHAGEEWAHVQNFRQAAREFVAGENDKWRAFETGDLATIHHALRMLAKFPFDEDERAISLADEAWAENCRRVLVEMQ